MAREEQSFILPGPVGDIEACLSFDTTWQLAPKTAAIICHPHPLYQGTMHNKVVTTVARTLVKLGIPNMRFNFRGVGKSQGMFDETVGETADCQAVLAWARVYWPQATFYLVGFSFGAYIASQVTSMDANIAQLVTIAPAVHHNDFQQLSGQITCPWLIIQPEEDEIVPPEAVYQWYEVLEANKTLVRVPACSHFFHGKLVELQHILTERLGNHE